MKKKYVLLPVSPTTRERLNIVKKNKEFKNYDELVKHLLYLNSQAELDKNFKIKTDLKEV